MADKLLQEFMQTWRWEDAIEHGVEKDMDKTMLRNICTPDFRIALYRKLSNGEYAIAPPRIALIPKDEPGEYREVMICEPIDRVFLSVANNLFFDMFPDFVSNHVYSYRKNRSCGKTVRDVSNAIVNTTTNIRGKKYDLKKFFDSTPLQYIDELFDKMETVYGKSAIIDVVREFYHCNLLFDADGNLVEIYKSIKQGTATSAFLADALLYDIDEYVANMDGVKYWRYSDDILILGENWQHADVILKDLLAIKQLAINPKKEECVYVDKWIKFLGFSIRGSQISLSKNRLKTFESEIRERTSNVSLEKAVNKVNAYLYKGEYPWASSVLSVINSEQDIQRLNGFVMDNLRAAFTGKNNLYGLGYDNTMESGVIPFATGKNVAANKSKIPYIDGYTSLMAYKKAPIDVKKALVLNM